MGVVDAAVVACLREGARGLEVLLCRRARRTGDPWSGHIALPGGRLAGVDRDALAAALREAYEEVGFDPLVHGALLGALAPLDPPPPRVALAAFVVEIREPVEIRLNAEIERTWWTPFRDLEPVKASVPELDQLVDGWRLPFPEASDVVVWGITYRLLKGLMQVDSRSDPSVIDQTG